MATIKVKNSVTSGSNPTGLTFGELAVNISDKKIYVGNAVGSTVTLHDQQNVVTSVNGATGAVTNVARINEGNTFSVQQVMNAGATMQSIYVSSGVTLAPATITLSNANPTINGSNSNLTLKATASGVQPANVLFTMHGDDIDVGGVPTATLQIQDSFGGVGQIHLDTNGTSGVVGITGGVSVRGTLSSTGLISAAAGISATSGSTFSAATVYITNSTANIDPLFIQHSSTGALKVATTGQSRRGAIKLGGSTTSTFNTFIENSDGTVTFYNGISNTGSNMISFSSSVINIPTTISGATFSGNISAPNIVNSVNGITGPVGIDAGSNITITQSGKTLTISSTASGSGSATGFTYASSAPGSPSIGDRWIDSDTGKEYVYVNDGSSSQWIEPVSSNGLSGVTYTSATNFLEFGVTGSFVKLGVNNTSPQYTLDVNGIINAPVGISAGPIISSGATFSGAVVSDGGYRITSSAINAQSGTTYTLLTSDNGKIITMNNGSAITLTVPAGLPIGFNTTVIQLGAGQVGITASSTTLNSFEGKLNLAGQHAAASIISYTTNVFNVAGGLTA